MSERGTTAFRTAFALAAGAAVAPLWIGDFPPLADLPQHAAQVSVLRHWGDAACGYPDLFEIRWFDPYWLGYALAWALSWAFPVATALRVVLSIAVVAIPLAALAPLRELGGDRWWVLLCLPLAYGFPMSAGFFSFLVPVPLALLLLRAGIRYARRPSLRGGLLLGAGCAALYLAHVFVLAAAGLLIAAMVAAAAPGLREIPRRLAPLLLALPAPIAWWLLSPAGDRARQASAPYVWGAERILDLPLLVTGVPGRWTAAAVLALALASFAWTRPKPAREPARWAPFGAVALVVLAAPTAFYLAPRFAILLFPTLLLAFDRAAPGSLPPARRGQVALVALALLAVVHFRFAGMVAEGRGLSAVLAAAPAGGSCSTSTSTGRAATPRSPPFSTRGCSTRSIAAASRRSPSRAISSSRSTIVPAARRRCSD